MESFVFTEISKAGQANFLLSGKASAFCKFPLDKAEHPYPSVFHSDWLQFSEFEYDGRIEVMRVIKEQIRSVGCTANLCV